MRFDTQNAGTWFYFNEQDESKGGVCLRICAGADVRRIDEQSSKPKVEYKRGNRFAWKQVNDKQYDALLWDFCIVDWDQVENEKGDLLGCTKEHKTFLMDNSVDFAMFVGKHMEELTLLEEQEKKETEKNSSSSQTG